MNSVPKVGRSRTYYYPWASPALAIVLAWACFPVAYLVGKLLMGLVR